MHVLLSDCMGSTAGLALEALGRLKMGFRPATLAAYTRMFRDFLAFLVSSGLHFSQVNTVIVLAFMEFLYKNTLSPANIANYMAGIRAMYIVNGLDTTPFRDDRLSLFMKSLKINAPFDLKIGSILSVDLLTKLIMACNTLDNPQVFKPLYLLAFFSFLRLSNILPHSARKFDLTRHLTRGDLIFAKKFMCTYHKMVQNHSN